MIRQKRNQLEGFVHEQLLGPGAMGYRFIDVLSDDIRNLNLKESEPHFNKGELINSAPAAIYSTGILFPEDKSQTACTENESNTSENDMEADGDSTNEHLQGDVEEGEAFNVNLMYPSTMGLTCCLESSVFETQEIQITLSARVYTHVPTKAIENRYGVLLECKESKLLEILNEYDLDGQLSAKVSVVEFGENRVLIGNGIKPDEIGPLKTKINEIGKVLCQKLGSEIPNQPISGFKEYQFRRLRDSVNDEVEQDSIKKIIEAIELYESAFAHIIDLLDIHDSKGYGLWKSSSLSNIITLPIITISESDRKIILNWKQYPALKNILMYQLEDGTVASLSANIQFSKDSRQSGSEVYLKIQVMNTSTPYQREEGKKRYYSAYNQIINQRAFFGVNVRVESPNLIPYKTLSLNKEPDIYGEDDITQFLYRQYQDYGIGHGCSVKWGQGINGLRFVETDYLPTCDTPDVDPIPRWKSKIIQSGDRLEPEPVFSNSQCLQIKWLSDLSDASDNEIRNALNDFVNTYEIWIKSKEGEALNGPHELKAMATQQLQACKHDMERIKTNIAELLDEVGMTSFRKMNAAMFIQMWHSVNVKNGTVKQKIGNYEVTRFDLGFYRKQQDCLFTANAPVTWRPFQLAFILLNLDGIIRPSSDATWKIRNEQVDLVWFPTGGGKTEAYLGIIAFCILYRRITNGANGGGTAVIMRYTLRLLTLQQFQRATLLIMALELLRRWDSKLLGSEPIYVGLWVGAGSLPNQLFESENSLEKEYEKIEESQKQGKKAKSKIPFTHCPWCGTELNRIRFRSIKSKDNTFEYNRILLSCSDPQSQCSFSNPLLKRRADHGPIPVSLCDEEIFQHPPALLFGTVDKFAQLAHKTSSKENERHKDSRRLFGRGNWEKGKPEKGYLTPDLIIQDELHLLLGPLGSAVALFECAVDRLCTREKGGIRIRPKIISSTATTRNTGLQIWALFDRSVNIFPKQGLECDDSFFAFYKRRFKDQVGTATFEGKRRYVGVLPTGKTQIWMQMRLIAVLLVHRAKFESCRLGKGALNQDDAFEEAMDFYHSVITYFNSLREVGKTESQVQTYILKEIRRVFNRVMRPGNLMHGLYTYAISSAELTGRLSGEDVKGELARVEQKLERNKRLAHTTSNSDKRSGTTPPDVVIATNMISVGIDVSRFNTMIINSMPRNIAEYIQASSRVARSKDGLVFTVHHPFRARDVSHYERFLEFHEKMYSYVEPISITPFTRKAVDRYLGLYVATMLRHGKDFVDRRSAGMISDLTDSQIQQLQNHLVEYFSKRVMTLQASDAHDTIKKLIGEEEVSTIQVWIHQALMKWKELSDKTKMEGKHLAFNRRPQNSKTLEEQLYIEIDEYEDNIHSEMWQIPQSLRVVEPEAVVRIKLQ